MLPHQDHRAEKTVERSSGAWLLVPSSRSFALLDAVSVPGRLSPVLTAEHEKVRKRVAGLRSRGLLSEGRSE
jgi:hypothetical protein